MRIAVVLLLMVPTVACMRGERDGKSDKQYAPPEQGPVPYPEVENAAPLHNVEGEPEQARTTMPQDEPRVESVEPDEQVRTELRAVGKSGTHGNVVLEEVADTVQITVDLENAQPGASRVLLEGHSCEDIAAVTAHPSAVSQRTAQKNWKSERDVVAKLDIGKDGEAHALGSVPNAHLRPDEAGTLLGKSVVVYRAKEIPGAAGAAPTPIACAPVNED